MIETQTPAETISAPIVESDAPVTPPAELAPAEALPATEVAEGSFTEMIADSFPEVTVLFADIVEFTRFSESLTPEALVGVLNDIFSSFDNIADARGLEKIKTIGDAYMAVAGLPVPVADHVERAANMALDMNEFMKRFNEKKHHNLQVRIGMSTGAAGDAGDAGVQNRYFF